MTKTNAFEQLDEAMMIRELEASRVVLELRDDFHALTRDEQIKEIVAMTMYARSALGSLETGH